MNSRLKRLMKLAAEADYSTLSAEADKALQAIERDKQPHLEAIASLDEQADWVRTTLKLALPASASQASKSPQPKPQAVPSEDGYTPKQRGQFIKDAAKSLIDRGIYEFSADDILAELKEKGVIFSITKPGSAISSVVIQMEGVTRVSPNRFRYAPTGAQDTPFPLIESQKAH